VKVLTDPAKVVLSIKAQRSVTEPEEGERSTEILSQ
jgi:hypothetical protein